MEKLGEKLKIPGSRGQRFFVLALAGTLLLLLFFYVVLHRPLQMAAADFRQQGAQAEKTVTAIANFQNAHLPLHDYQRELGRRERRARQALPGSMEQGEFLVALDRLAVRSHLRILSVVPGKAAADEGRHCLPVKLQLTGNYFSLLHFLQGLQQGERLVVINSLTVKQGKDREDALTAELGLRIFSVPDE